MKYLSPILALFLGSASANCGLTESGAKSSSSDGEVFENLYINASVDDDTALFIRHNNVVIRNLVIHHAANRRGIYFFEADNLTIENVEVIAYGVHATTDQNNWGANPCPVRKPFEGYNCNNI